MYTYLSNASHLLPHAPATYSCVIWPQQMGKRSREPEVSGHTAAVAPRKTLKIRKKPQEVLLWPPLSWMRRAYLTSDESGTCRGLVTWPKYDADWTRFLAFVIWAGKEVHASDKQWQEACAEARICDMSRYAEVRLVRSWLIDMDRVQSALARHPPSAALEKQIHDAVTDYI
ncbi:hypothetical protein LTR24_009965 [Lithohypha guttulata]|uniref:Uncharacterized protein n=1 Tax=Lithohypha guttulata TaxID=1690604 RepID=A0ABR0JVE8_9EURO|nr:hypothetical protein LTR24_009965 [Lithohypha guttulata]